MQIMAPFIHPELCRIYYQAVCSPVFLGINVTTIELLNSHSLMPSLSSVMIHFGSTQT